MSQYLTSCKDLAVIALSNNVRSFDQKLGTKSETKRRI